VYLSSFHESKKSTSREASAFIEIVDRIRELLFAPVFENVSTPYTASVHTTCNNQIN